MLSWIIHPLDVNDDIVTDTDKNESPEGTPLYQWPFPNFIGFPCLSFDIIRFVFHSRSRNWSGKFLFKSTPSALDRWLDRHDPSVDISNPSGFKDGTRWRSILFKKEAMRSSDWFWSKYWAIWRVSSRPMVSSPCIFATHFTLGLSFDLHLGSRKDSNVIDITQFVSADC